MAKLDLLNRLIQEPNFLDLELLALVPNSKFNEDSFNAFLALVTNNYEVCLVNYFVQGMQKNIWHKILEVPHFIEFSSIVVCEYFRSQEHYREATKISATKILSFFTKPELVLIAKQLMNDDTEAEEIFNTIRIIYKQLPAPEKCDLFKHNMEVGFKSYFKFDEYLGSWNDSLLDSTPLYFEYFNKAFSYNEVSFASGLELINKHKSKFDLSLQYEGLNFCEFLTQKIILHFRSEVIACVAKDFFDLLDTLLEEVKFKNSQILKPLKDAMLSLDPAIFPFILKRWNLEKYTYADSYKLELLREILQSFYDQNVVKYFFNDFSELLARNPNHNLLDLIEIFPLDFEIFNPQVMIQQFKDLKLSLKSKNFTTALSDCIDLKSHDQLQIYHTGVDALFYLLKEKPHNYLYLDFTYLRALLKAAEEQRESTDYQLVVSLLSQGEEYKRKEILAKVPTFLSKNAGFKSWISKSNLIDPEILDRILKVHSEKDLAKEILGTDSAYAQKVLSSYLLRGKTFDYPKIFWLFHLVKSGFNYDRTVNFITGQNLSNYVKELPYAFFRNLKLFFSEEKIFSLIIESQRKRTLDQIIKDTHKSLEFVIAHNLVELATNKFKGTRNLIDLHNRTSVILKFVTQPNFALDQKNLEMLMGQKIKDYTIYLPQGNHELIDLGKSLHICVGDGQYGQQIKKKQIYILALKAPNDKYSHCIEIDRNSLKIKQAKTYHNKEISSALVNLLQEKLYLLR